MRPGPQQNHTSQKFVFEQRSRVVLFTQNFDQIFLIFRESNVPSEVRRLDPAEVWIQLFPVDLSASKRKENSPSADSHLSVGQTCPAAPPPLPLWGSSKLQNHVVQTGRDGLGFAWYRRSNPVLIL